MEPMYSDVANEYLCPYSLPTETPCRADKCLAWEIVPQTDGCGICTRLSQYRIIQTELEEDHQ